MPKSKNWESYPEAFVDLVREASVRQVNIPVADLKAGQKLCGYLYGFHSALKGAFVKGQLPEEMKPVYFACKKVKYTSPQEVGGQWHITAMPRDLDPMAQSVAAALRAQGVSTPAADVFTPSADLLSLATAEEEKRNPNK